MCGSFYSSLLFNYTLVGPTHTKILDQHRHRLNHEHYVYSALESTQTCFLLTQRLPLVHNHPPTNSASPPGGLAGIQVSSCLSPSGLIPTALTATLSLGQEVGRVRGGQSAMMEDEIWKQSRDQMQTEWGNRRGLVLHQAEKKLWLAVVSLLDGVFVPLLGHCGWMEGLNETRTVCHKWDKVTFHRSLLKDWLCM